MTAINDLLAFQRQTEALSSIAERLGWDQETVMPRGAVEQRAEEMAAMESVLHERRTDPRIGEWLDRAEPRTEAEARSVELIARDFSRANRIPAKLAQELARLTSLSQSIWAEARAKDAPEDFLPTLDQVLVLKRDEAAALADGGDPYRAFVCHTINPWGFPAKDRSGRLGQVEEPHLGRLMDKIRAPGTPAPRRLTFTPPAEGAADHPLPQS